MTEICRVMDHRYRKVAKEQDAFGWRCFMEGMICHGLRSPQEMCTTVNGLNITREQWAKGVIIKLLEIIHGQWLYCCVQVHDRVSRTQATQRKEEPQMAIKAQHDIGQEDLLEENKYLAEVNLEDLEHTLGKR